MQFWQHICAFRIKIEDIPDPRGKPENGQSYMPVFLYHSRRYIEQKSSQYDDHFNVFANGPDIFSLGKMALWYII